MTALARRLWPCLLALILAGAPARALAEDKAHDPLAARAEMALWLGDIEGLEALYNEARHSKAENPWNGRPAVQSVRSGIAAVLGYGRLDGTYFRELELLTAGWTAQKPDSVLRHLLHARVLYARAWHLRGGGYWNTVPEPARAEFERLITQAERVIADRAPMLMQDTTAHLYLLMIGRSAGWRPEQSRAIVEDGLSRSQADTLHLLYELVTTLLPKWQGDVAQAAQAIDTYSRQVDPARRDETYALLWSNVASGVDGNVFRQATADWPRIRSGFNSLATRLKQPYFKNRLAYLACLAQDRDTARAGMAAIGEPDLDAWQGGGAGGQQNHEACTLWLRSAR